MTVIAAIKAFAVHKDFRVDLYETMFQFKTLQCVAIQVKRPSLCLCSLTLSIMKGLAKTLSTSHYLSDNRFFERKFCRGFISNGLPLWSECRTHLEQLLDQKTTVSHSLRGRIPINKPLKSFGFTTIPPGKLRCPVRLRRVLSGEKEITCARCTQARQLLCSLVCRGFQGLNWE